MVIARRLVLIALAAGFILPARAGERFILLASTTSTENSGLFAHLLPIFTASTGIEVRVVARGTGEQSETQKNG